jgi:hypothetical protein
MLFEMRLGSTYNMKIIATAAQSQCQTVHQIIHPSLRPKQLLVLVEDVSLGQYLVGHVRVVRQLQDEDDLSCSRQTVLAAAY